MQALFELTDGERTLKQIIKSFPTDSAHWNEAQNRFHFVDRLLTECLGWDRTMMNVEETDELGGRSDYTLGVPAKAVVEAKREAKLWDIPPFGKPGLVRKMEPIIRASKNFKEVVTQVIPYCSLRGAHVAVVCNGPQLAIFQVFVPGMSPLEGECILFDGLNTLLDSFPHLWRFLSPEGISENRAYRELALLRNPRMPQKAYTAIPEPFQYKYRSDFQENLRELSTLLMEVVEENPALKPDFYRDCYVPIPANSRHLLQSKNLIAARYRRVSDDGVAPVALDSGVIRKDGTLKSGGLLGDGMGRPIVVVGDVGVGKTSFFENLHEQLRSLDKSRTYFIHINLGISANLSDGLKSYVLNEVPRVLRHYYDVNIFDRDFVESIYYRDLQDFARSVEGSLKSLDPSAYERARIDFTRKLVDRRDAHLEASLAHLNRGRGKQIVLILDNADQRDFDTQQEAFLIAQELAATRNLIVFVALRPSTFYVSKTRGALSGYQNKVLTISPPPAEEVVLRRLEFAVRVAEGKVRPGTLEGIRVHATSVVLFMTATLRAIKTNEAIRQFLSNITGGNTREIVELTTAFIGSPNVNSEKIVNLEERTGNYKVPLHEFTKHALLGDYAYYNPNSSTVASNMFDVSTPDSREHFLPSLIISFLSSSAGPRDNDGFVAGKRISEQMAGLGFLEDQIKSALKGLAKALLIQTPHAHYREIQVDDAISPELFQFRATTVGIYHVRYWTGAFGYLDAVSIDTPIFDESVREKVHRLAASLAIKERFLKATLFRNYLESQWHLATISASYYDFPALLRSQEDTFDAVERYLQR